MIEHNSQAECWYNLEIHTEVYILIDLCSVEARVIIPTGSSKFYTVTSLYLHISKMAANRWDQIYNMTDIWAYWFKFDELGFDFYQINCH